MAVNIIKTSQRDSGIVAVAATTVQEYNFNDTKPSALQIRNYSSAVIYVGITPLVSSTGYYEIAIAANGTGVTVIPNGVNKIYLYATAGANIRIYSWETDLIAPADLDRTIISQLLSAAITISAALPAGANIIGKVGIDQTTPGTTNGVQVVAALPAGANNIGDVDVLTLPALPAGANNIGDVDVLSLPAIPAGTNNIGDVDVLSLPAIPAGTNNIGDVDVLTMPDDVTTPEIYNVTCTSADTEYSQALPANCRRFALSVRGGLSANSLRIAYVTGKVATPTAPYFQIDQTQEYFEDKVKLAAQTIYFASSAAGAVAQIIAWV